MHVPAVVVQIVRVIGVHMCKDFTFSFGDRERGREIAFARDGMDAAEARDIAQRPRLEAEDAEAANAQISFAFRKVAQVARRHGRVFGLSQAADQRDPRLFLYLRPRGRNQETHAPVVVGVLGVLGKVADQHHWAALLVGAEGQGGGIGIAGKLQRLGGQHAAAKMAHHPARLRTTIHFDSLSATSASRVPSAIHSRRSPSPIGWSALAPAR